jgi:hypothetical protein
MVAALGDEYSAVLFAQLERPVPRAPANARAKAFGRWCTVNKELVKQITEAAKAEGKDPRGAASTHFSEKCVPCAAAAAAAARAR